MWCDPRMNPAAGDAGWRRQLCCRVVGLTVIGAVLLGAGTTAQALPPVSLPPVDSLLWLAQTTPLDTEYVSAVTVLDAQVYAHVDSLHSRWRVHRAVQVHNEFEVDEVGDQSLRFPGRNLELTGVSARTILPSGEVFPVDSAEFRINSEVSDLTIDMLSLNWLFPRVDSGAIIEFALEFAIALEQSRDLSVDLFLTESRLVRHQYIEVSFPASWPVHHEQSGRMRLAESLEGDYRVLRWRGDSIPEYEWEMAAPPQRELAEWVRAYIERTWDEGADWMWNRMRPRLVIDDSIRAVAREWTKGKRSRSDRIAALFEKVARDVRYELTPLRGSPPEPREPRAVLATGFGDCKDKSALLIALLGAVDIPALPALITSTDSAEFMPENADIGQFDHMIVYLPEDGGRFVDPTCDICRWNEMLPNYGGKPALVIGETAPARLRWVSRAAQRPDSAIAVVRAVLDSSGRVTARVSLRETGDQAFKICRPQEERDTSDIRHLVSTRARGVIWKHTRELSWDLRIPDPPADYFDCEMTCENDSLFLGSRNRVGVPVDIGYALPYVYDADTVDRRVDYVEEEPYFQRVDMLVVHGPHWDMEYPRLSWTVDTTWFSASSVITTWPESSLVSTQFSMPPYRLAPREYARMAACVESLRERSKHQFAVYRKRPDPARVQRLQDALTANPDNIQVLAALAQLYLGDDDGGNGCAGRSRRAEARALLERAWRLDTGNETPLLTIVRLLLIDDLHLEADSLMQEFLSAHPGSSGADDLRAQIASGLGRNRDVLEILQRNTNPTTRARLGRAEAHSALGDREGVEEELSLLEALGGDPEEIRDTKIRALVWLGEYAEAESLLAAIEEPDEDFQFGITSWIVGQRDGHAATADLYGERLRIDPDDPLLNNNYAWGLAWKDSLLVTALSAAEKAVTLRGPCDWSNQNTLGFVLLKLGRIDEARRLFTECLAAQDADSRSANYYCLAECDRAQGLTESAIRYYKMAIDINGDRFITQRAAETLAAMGVPAPEIE